MLNWFKKTFDPEPDPYIFPSQEGKGLGMNFYIERLYDSGQNTTFPRIGDVFHFLESDSMGACIRRHNRMIVKEIWKIPGSKNLNRVVCQRVDTGATEVHNISMMRQLVGYRRQWAEFN